MKKALVCGGGGFIGNHLVNRLKSEGYWVRVVDLKYPEFQVSEADDFIIGDLQDPQLVSRIMCAPGQETVPDYVNSFDEVYQLGCRMGGAGYVFTKINDADIIHDSALINLNVAKYAVEFGIKKLFYSSSACMYPEYNQLDPENPKCSEDSAYPALPDSCYGWEKLFSEILYDAFSRNHGLQIRIARFHNIFGTLSTFSGGREKAPAALCRKVIECPDGGTIDIWGDGKQTRSFLFIDECIEGVRRLMESNFVGPVNIGSEEMISINDFARMIIGLSGKNISINNIPGPEGVRGRNSDNTLIKEKLNWAPSEPLIEGIKKTYKWIEEQKQTPFISSAGELHI